jgi:hypothetical protein
MMKPWYLFLGCCLMALSACQWNVSHNTPPAVTKDTLVYSYETIRQKANDCGDKTDSGCTIVNIKYPVFKAQPVLNDTIKHHLLTLFSLNTIENSLDGMVRHFLAQYHSSKSQKNRPAVPYDLNMDASIIRQDSSLTTLQLTGYTYTGGAHGSTLTYFVNWDTQAGKSVALNSILKPGYEKELTSTAESIFRAQEHLAKDASLKENYFFKDGVFSLNNNFTLTPIGIRFLYNQYEIKPYAAGQTNLLIPYSKIKSLLLPHTVVSKYIK